MAEAAEGAPQGGEAAPEGGPQNTDQSAIQQAARSQAPQQQQPQQQGGEQAPEGGEQQAQTQEQQRYARMASRAAQLERELKKAKKHSAETESKLQELERLDQQLNENPWEVIQQRGHKIDDWTARILKGEQQEPDPTEQLKSEIEELKGKLSEREKREQTEAEKAHYSQLLQTVQQGVENHPDLAFTSKLGHAETVLQKIQQYHQEYGECPDAEQERIARDVEQQLRQTVGEQIQGLVQIPEFRQELQKMLQQAGDQSENPSSADQQASQGHKPQTQTRAQKARSRLQTLTNQQSATVQERRAPQPRQTGDRRAAALEGLRKARAERRSR